MKNLIIISTAIAALVLVSCKKETITSKYSFKIPTSEGSYWEYEWVKVEANGSETPLNISERVTIMGDTLVNGLRYIKYQKEYLNQINSYSYQLLRDSLGVVVDDQGVIIYSPNQFGKVLEKRPDQVFPEWKLEMYDNVTVSTPVGTFDAIDARRTYYDPSGAPITNCGNQEFVGNVYYADGIGKVKEVTAYYSDVVNCNGYIEIRLVDYHIE